MPKKQPQPIYLKDYQVPDFLLEEIKLHFDIYTTKTIVSAELYINRNSNHKRPLVLDGDSELKLVSVLLDGKAVRYKQTKDQLIIKQVPNTFVLQTKIELEPHKNTALEGLYQSKGTFCTQCEPHGFRRITYFIDRPDIMTRFTTTICAAKKRYPVLLANGNLIKRGTTKNGRHFAVWQDPSLKSGHLFALIAGKLEHINDYFITKSGRTVALKIYCEPGYKQKCRYAMGALKRAMQWDEEKFGREYDLDIYMLVAISDFNMGAMENKGLNIFNSKYVFVDPKTATEDDYVNVENVVGHEYFHNWTGNRVGCRDWFQLSLKEGLTTFRDQLFTADMRSEPVKRIKDANIIRSRQFAEDSGPMSHPVQPKSYVEINNFYTLTVYHKGAEVMRMLRTILGAKKFRQGMNLYFNRHDGTAATIDNFIAAMESVSGVDLKQFKKWYDVAGTPQLKITSNYDHMSKVFSLTIKQDKSLHIPLAIGLLNSRGKSSKTQILEVKNKTEIFQFNNIKAKPIVSLLRDFSAPVKLNYKYSEQELLFLMQHDNNAFSRWNAVQELATNMVMQLIKDYRKDKDLIVSPGFIWALGEILTDEALDPELITLLLTMPTDSYLIEHMKVADVDAIYHATELVKQTIAKELELVLFSRYKVEKTQSLKNLCLHYLLCLKKQKYFDLALQQSTKGKNMTAVIGGLRGLVDFAVPEREQALAVFYKTWKHEELVINKWLELQAVAKLPNTLQTVKKLTKHPAFNIKNPNKVYVLIRAFAKQNPVRFHAINGAGYKFLTQQVLQLDRMNPQVAAAIIEPLINWRKFDKTRQQLMRKQLMRIKQQPKLSKNLHEIVQKSLRI
ncbi:MAG: aminopeptidase N [Gammaproteobacteria bacterium]|nr:aminopeptidase N [Gammaproteobacteria bacterium]